MKFIDTEIMEMYLQGKADEEEKNKVMTWLMLNLKSPYADKEFEELLEKVPPTKQVPRPRDTAFIT